ncbi:nucleoside diphosphate kinase regulator [Pseudohoeflea coraliihabitans]|uniref:Nucleoside diphosphate kinase regulator n=1 Tax=Pseudohoeflea coraliihabitans TaxID=2860393 RepID=A0ABS6WQR9_9HYPH|nr:nucleoside diphosphate kinase regulator [Pseudohoeflea sp. DP4N28-3]MBW3098291.1 nucleoside diphosphate kinase regulator [Pseudohoeflea sp. DP4N28-3]
MAAATKKTRKPAIRLCETDHQRLSSLAEAALAGGALRNAGAAAETLLAELDRARVVSDSKLRDDVVRMGSDLRFSSDLGEDRTMTLVYPGEADIAAGRISVLTPIGAALIGLSVGQSIDWTARDGRVHRLTVQSVGASEPLREAS